MSIRSFEVTRGMPQIPEMRNSLFLTSSFEAVISLASTHTISQMLSV
jgi:hypothetical protein